MSRAVHFKGPLRWSSRDGRVHHGVMGPYAVCGPHGGLIFDIAARGDQTRAVARVTCRRCIAILVLAARST